MARSVERKRVVAVGDLNGAADVLWDILRGTGLVNARGQWSGGDAELVQVGDLFNRGGGAREALELLLRLRRQARSAGGRVSILLGNHEVMTALGNEAYCTEAEYLSFATQAERARWRAQLMRAMGKLYHEHEPGGPIEPLGPRLELWKVRNVPGRLAMRKALSSEGRLGRALRALPVAVRAAGAVFVHAGLVPHWARRGIDGLNGAAREAWTQAQASGGFFDDQPDAGLFRAERGPLWNRTLAMGDGPAVRAELSRALELVGARRMVIGHTATHHLPGGAPGRVLARFGAKLVCIDVGLSSGEDTPRTALLIEGDTGREWTPQGTRVLWRDRG